MTFFHNDEGGLKMKVCKYCGRENDENSNFCASCGKILKENNQGYNDYDYDYNNQGYNNQGYNNQGYNNQGYNGQRYNNQGYNNYGYNNQRYAQSPMNPNGRSVGLWVFLSIITCGICGIIWMIDINDEINRRVNDTQAPSGGMVFLYSLITCGIYGYIWAFKMGEKYDYLKGTPDGSSSILFLVLQMFGFGIVNYAVMQDYLNKVY